MDELLKGSMKLKGVCVCVCVCVCVRETETERKREKTDRQTAMVGCYVYK